MSKISERSYSVKTRANRLGLRQRMTKKVRDRPFPATFKRAKTASMFHLAFAVLSAVMFAVVLSLSLAAGVLYFIA